MSDFDNFFAKKLGEERDFPRREKNWRALSNRLDAFDAGLQHPSNNLLRHMRYWQAAAACAVVAAGLLGWKVTAVHRENDMLRQELVSLQGKNRTLRPQAEAVSPAAYNPLDINGTSERTPLRGSDAQPQNKMHKPGSFKTAVDNTNINKPASLKHEQANISGIHLSEEIIAGQPASGSNIYTLQTPGATLDSMTNKGQSGQAKAASMALPVLPARRIFDVSPSSVSGQEKAVILLPLSQPSGASAAMIKPAPLASRIRAGIQAVAGSPLPKDDGVSWLRGHGITGEYNIWRGFWATSSVDWLKYDVSTQQFLPKYHTHNKSPDPPHHTGGGNPPKKLVQVESSERRQEYGIGLRYAFPWRFWVRPSVSIQHTWIHTSPHIISFKFEKPPHGGGPHGNPDPDAEYVVRNTQAQNFGNVWRFGAGLEHETKYWVFSLKADYSNNFAASDLTFDALMLKGGIQYKFN